MTEEKTSLSKEEQDMIEEIFNKDHEGIPEELWKDYHAYRQYTLELMKKALQKGKEMAFLEKTQEKTDDMEQCRRCGVQCKKTEIRISSCDDHFGRIGKRTICYKAECRICPDCFYGYDKNQSSKIADLEEKLKKENEMSMKLAKENEYFHKWVDEKTLRISELEKENQELNSLLKKASEKLYCPEFGKNATKFCSCDSCKIRKEISENLRGEKS